MINRIQENFVRFLRWSEQYIKTDMIYLAKTGWWINLDIVIISAVSLLLSIVFANALTPSTYGLYQYILSISALVTAVSLAGMNTAVTQAVARGYEGSFLHSIKEQIRWAPIPALLALLGSVYYFLQGNTEIGVGLLIITVLNPIISICNTYGAFLQGKKEFKQIFYFNLLTNLVYAFCIAAVIWFVKDAVLLVFINLSLNACITFLIFKKTIKKYKPNTNIDPGFVLYGRKLSVLSAWGTIVNQADSILVFHFLGPVNLAVYTFATILPERVASLFGFIGTASFFKFIDHDISYIQKNIFIKIFKIGIVSAIFAGLYSLCAPLIFTILFPKYLYSVHFTQLYSPIIILLSILNVTNSIFYAKKYQKEIYIFGIVQPILLIFLQLPLIVFYGIMGMIFARLITEVIVILVGLFFTFFPLSKDQEGEIKIQP
jgi:O-antigen/teichoic acid export membrane protein